MIINLNHILKSNYKRACIKLILLGLVISILYFLTTRNASRNSSINRTQIKAFIISADCRSLRYNSTKENIERVFPKFFTFICFLTIPLNDSRIHTSNVLLWRKFSSNLLAFVDLWTYEIPKYANENEHQWSLIFEDDVNFSDPSKLFLPNYIAPLQDLMNNRDVKEKDGFFYLGICGPTFVNTIPSWISTRTNGSLYNQKGYGYCLHATGITAKRSRSFWGEVASYRPNSADLALDSQVREYSIRSQHYFYTLGSNFHYPPGTGHYGIAFQDRGRFASTI